MKKGRVYWLVIIVCITALFGGMLTLVQHFAPALLPWIIAWLFATSAVRLQRAGL